jgi:hypothetical protein
MQEVLRGRIELVKPVLERLQTRLVSMGLLSGKHGVPLCAELRNADVQEAVVRVGASRASA